MKTNFTLNGQKREFDHHPGETLLETLRQEGLYSVKFSSEDGQAGADTVWVDGSTINSNLMLTAQLEGKSVQTLEALNQRELSPLQGTFLDEGAAQCGYCTPGMIMAILALEKENPQPSEAEVREALSAVYCRCTGYVKPVKAALKYFANSKPGTEA